MQLPLKKKIHMVRKKIMPTIKTQLQNNQIQTLKCCMNSLCTPVVVQRELLRFRQESMSPLVFAPEIDYKQFYKPVPHPVVTGSEQKFCEALSYCIGVVGLGGSQHLLHEHSLDRQTHKPANHS